MRVIVASDKFKGSLTAAQVAHHVTLGLRRVVPDLAVARVPVADGGDGTVAAALSAGFRFVPVCAEGPTGARVRTGYAVRNGVAVVELADVSGLRRLPGTEFAPMTASSYGTGEVLRAALDAGCREMVLGVGGSACTDGGAGMVQALGARLYDMAGVDIARGGGALSRLHRIDLASLHPSLATTDVVVASDVDNPLLGVHGAAAVYGPQKGASAADVASLDAALHRWAALVRDATGVDLACAPGAGAAGGVGFGALAVLGASMRPGIELILDLVDFAGQMQGATLVITGEGSLDDQTLRGKAPAGVAMAARPSGVPVVAVAGRCLLSPQTLQAAGIRRAYALTELEPDPHRCLRDAGQLLERVAEQVARDWVKRYP